MTDNQTTSEAASLIALFIDADRWMPRERMEDHPILGRVIARRDERYNELKRKMGFTDALMTANAEAVQEIINGVQ